jgi:hypothetical protein
MNTVLHRVLSFLDQQYRETGDEVVARLHNDLEKVVRTQQGTEADEARLQAAAEAATCAARTLPPGTSVAAWRVKDVVEALRPYIAPAGTVPVSVETLRDVLYHIQIADNTGGSALKTLPIIAAKIRALIPPPPRPEPPKELVAEWERKGLEYAKAQEDCHESVWDTLTKCYVAALRAAWEAKGGA